MSSPNLRITTKQVHLVHELELSRFISYVYKRPYSMQQVEFLSQDTMLSVTVGDHPSESVYWGQEAFEEWRDRDANDHDQHEDNFMRTLTWQREYGCSIEPIMQDLFKQGLLPAGDYIVHVWW